MNEGMTFTFDEATGFTQRFYTEESQQSLQKLLEEERKRRAPSA